MPIRLSSNTARLKGLFWLQSDCWNVIPIIPVALIQFPNLRVTKLCEWFFVGNDRWLMAPILLPKLSPLTRKRFDHATRLIFSQEGAYHIKWLLKNVLVFKRFYRLSLMPKFRIWVFFNWGALHPVTPPPIKARPFLCICPPMAEKSSPPALQGVGDSEHYYGKRYKN